jgi:hypothetical protein
MPHNDESRIAFQLYGQVRTGEVFTFRADLRRRGLAGGLTTG